MENIAYVVEYSKTKTGCDRFNILRSIKRLLSIQFDPPHFEYSWTFFFFRRFCKHRQHCAEGTLFLPGNGDNGCFPANEFETRETAGEVCKGRIYLGRIQLENGELPRNYRTRKGSLPPINITLTQWPRNYGIQTKL